MNFVFISPNFPKTYWNFCDRLQNGQNDPKYAKQGKHRSYCLFFLQKAVRCRPKHQKGTNQTDAA